MTKPKHEMTENSNGHKLYVHSAHNICRIPHPVRGPYSRPMVTAARSNDREQRRARSTEMEGMMGDEMELWNVGSLEV